MLWERLEDIKTAFEDQGSHWSPRELHLARLISSMAAQLQRQQQKCQKWKKRAEELQDRLQSEVEDMMEALRSRESNDMSDEDGTKTETKEEENTWRRKEEKEDREEVTDNRGRSKR